MRKDTGNTQVNNYICKKRLDLSFKISTEYQRHASSHFYRPRHFVKINH
jgi:hypothetical protein